MHEAPVVRRPREVFDSQGRLLGRTQGFRPDPGSGDLGLELELATDVREAIDAEVRSVWIEAGTVEAVRRDRMRLDLSLEEIGRLVRRPRSVELARPSTRDPLEA